MKGGKGRWTHEVDIDHCLEGVFGETADRRQAVGRREDDRRVSNALWARKRVASRLTSYRQHLKGRDPDVSRSAP